VVQKRLCMTLLLVVVLLISITGNQVSTVLGHVAGRTFQAWASTPPTINGEIVSSEWQNAYSQSLSLTIGANSYTGTFYVMNDAANLYIAIKIADDDFYADVDASGIYFDNDNDGTYESGEDSIALYAGATGFQDRFLESFPTMKLDTDVAGGTKDGLGACARHGSDNHFEFSHPLDSPDDAHDFSLSPLNTVGFTMVYRDGVDGLGWGYWPASATQVTTSWGDIVIASAPPTLSAWCSAAPTIDGTVGAAEWQNAAHAPIAIGWTFVGDLWIMNDAENLYIAVKIADSSLTALDRVYIAFDNNNDGTRAVGDDILGLQGDSYFMDLFYSGITKFDTAEGGTSEGEGGASGSAGFNYFELKHPLDSTDNAHDFSLSAGDTVGFLVEYWEEASGYYGDWPSLNIKSWAHASVASAPAPEPDFQITSDPASISVAQGGSSSSTIKVQSLNGFSSAVTLSWSWFGAAPSDVTIDLPSSLTPPADGIGTATLTVTTAATATIGDYTLKVTGVSGTLTHTADVSVSISAAATTTTTTTTPTTTTTTPTTTATTTPTTTTTPSPTATPPPGGCLVATATYGSELSPEVQFLRGFRDQQVLSTFAGSGFMKAFNAWYYSFSPSVADFIANNPTVRGAMKILLYPLVGILHLSASAYAAFNFNPELAVCIAGLLASGLIGIVYFSPFALAILAILRRTRRLSLSMRNMVPLVYIWAASVGFLALSVLTLSPVVMMASSALFVLTTIGLTSLSTALKILQRFP